MATAGVGLSTDPDPVRSAEEALGQALTAVERPSAALLVATPSYGEAMPRLLDAATGALGGVPPVGATAHGVLGCGREIEEERALVALALGGIDAEPFLLPEVDPRDPRVGDDVRARLGGAPRAEDLVVLLPDPRGVPLIPVIEDLREAVAPAVVVGAGAADPVWDRTQQWCGREVASGGLAGLVLRGTRAPRVGVTQACRPVTEVLTVTRAQGHWILELDGRPALDVYREVARGPLGEDLRRAARFVLAALPRDPAAPLEPGGYLVRNLVGFGLEEKALAVPDAVAPGDALAFAVREPETARDDLKAMLAAVGGAPATAALYFDCCARGASFFGVPGLEVGYLEQALGATPTAGLFGSCEIGPIAGRPELLTYTGVLALIG